MSVASEKTDSMAFVPVVNGLVDTVIAGAHELFDRQLSEAGMSEQLNVFRIDAVIAATDQVLDVAEAVAQ